MIESRLGDPTRPPRILVVDDEPSFIDALEVGLRREGFDVISAVDGRAALERFRQDAPDLILLDVMLPGLSGVDVCRAIRTESPVPVIMVTARSGEIDTVVGLEVGADDYVAKPYRMRELVARIRALLRRSGEPTGGIQRPSDVGAVEVKAEATEPNPESAIESTAESATESTIESTAVIKSGGVIVDVDQHRVTVDGVEVFFPLKEFELLRLMVANAGRVMTRDLLIERVWGADYFGDTKTLDVHIKRLRGKVEASPGAPQRITTVRGVGYRFERSDDS